MRRRDGESAKALGTGSHVATYLLVFLAGLFVAWWFWSGTASAAPAQEEDVVDDVVQVVHDPVAVVNDVVDSVSHEVERTPAAPVVEIVEPAAPIVESVSEATVPVTNKVGEAVDPLAAAVPPIPALPPPPLPELPSAPLQSAVPVAAVIPVAGVTSTPISVLDAASPTSPIAIQDRTSVLAPETRGMARVSGARTELQRGPAGLRPAQALAATTPAVSGGGVASPAGPTSGPVGPASLATVALPSGAAGPLDDGPRLLAVMAMAAAAAWAASRMAAYVVMPASAGALRPSFTPD